MKKSVAKRNRRVQALRGVSVLALILGAAVVLPVLTYAQSRPSVEGLGRAEEKKQITGEYISPKVNVKEALKKTNPLMPSERELAMKIKEPFTLTAVGDLIVRTPIGLLTEPGFAGLIQHIRNADVGYANMEGPLIDQDNFPHGISNAAFGGAPLHVANTIKSMGVDIVGTANNMQMDGGIPGMLDTIQNLNAAGIVFAGTGRNLGEARSARYLGTPKGVVGLVACWAMDSARRDGGTYRVGNKNGRPGLNPLHLTTYGVVTAEQMEQLRKIRDSIYARRGEVFAPIAPLRPDAPKDRLLLFNQSFKIGEKPGDVSYAMEPDDLRENLRAIRHGKQQADFMIASCHVHQGNYAFQTYTYDNDTPDFLIEYAHKAIDNGADVYVGHGVHTIRGIEIYKGKPIFYGLDSFIYQYQSSLPQDPGPLEMTEAEEIMSPNDFGGSRITQPERMESLLTESKFENGQLVEVRIYPADLGQDLTRPFSRVGIPMTPSPEMAKRVLEKLQKLSKPFGTEIAIENGVGVIRIPRTQAGASGK